MQPSLGQNLRLLLRKWGNLTPLRLLNSILNSWMPIVLLLIPRNITWFSSRELINCACDLPVLQSPSPRQIQKAVSKAKISAKTYQLKHKGTVVNDARSLSWDLVQLGVPVTKVNNAIHRVSRIVGITALGDISNRTVRPTVLEGGVASEIQIADELRQTSGKL